jgi:hypothetical protein
MAAIQIKYRSSALSGKTPHVGFHGHIMAESDYRETKAWMLFIVRYSYKMARSAEDQDQSMV